MGQDFKESLSLKELCSIRKGILLIVIAFTQESLKELGTVKEFRLL